MNDDDPVRRAICTLVDDVGGSFGDAPVPAIMRRIARRTKLRRRVTVIAAAVVLGGGGAVGAQLTEDPSERQVVIGSVAAQRPTPEAVVARGRQFSSLGDGPGGVAYVVAEGQLGTKTWVVASTGFGSRERECLLADDDVFDEVAWCANTDPDKSAWQQIDRLRPGVEGAAVWGFVNSRAATVRITFADGQQHDVDPVWTPTSRGHLFFAWASGDPQRRAVKVQLLDGNGVPIEEVGESQTRECKDTAELSLPCPTPGT